MIEFDVDQALIDAERGLAALYAGNFRVTTLPNAHRRAQGPQPGYPPSRGSRAARAVRGHSRRPAIGAELP